MLGDCDGTFEFPGAIDLSDKIRMSKLYHGAFLSVNFNSPLASAMTEMKNEDERKGTLENKQIQSCDEDSDGKKGEDSKDQNKEEN